MPLGPGPDENLSCVAKQEDMSDAPTNRIVGGNFGNFAPYQIFFGFVMKANNSLGNACGGTILNKRFILTAKHCMYEDRTEVNSTTAIMKVVVGELDWCKAIGLDVETPPKNFSLAARAPLFKEKFESVKDVSEVFIHQEADLAILKVAPRFVIICIKLWCI